MCMQAVQGSPLSPVGPMFTGLGKAGGVCVVVQSQVGRGIERHSLNREAMNKVNVHGKPR